MTRPKYPANPKRWYWSGPAKTAYVIAGSAALGFAAMSDGVRESAGDLFSEKYDPAPVCDCVSIDWEQYKVRAGERIAKLAGKARDDYVKAMEDAGCDFPGTETGYKEWESRIKYKTAYDKIHPINTEIATGFAN